MFDWIRKLFSEPTTAVVIFANVVIGLFTGFLQGVIQFKYGGASGFLAAVATGMTVALIVGLGIQDYIHSETTRLCIVGACAVIGPDILAGLKALGKGLRRDPIAFIVRLLEAFRGGRGRGSQEGD